MRTARASASIQIPLPDAWRLITNFAGYGAWNPFIVRVDAPTAPAVGDKLVLHVRWPKGSGGAVSSVRITEISPPAPAPDGTVRARLVYAYADLPSRFGLIRSLRTQSLTQAPGGPTVYETQEDFTGALIRFLPMRQVQAGFEAHAAALKARLEARG